jgi:hypothetical protein
MPIPMQRHAVLAMLAVVTFHGSVTAADAERASGSLLNASVPLVTVGAAASPSAEEPAVRSVHAANIDADFASMRAARIGDQVRFQLAPQREIVGTVRRSEAATRESTALVGDLLGTVGGSFTLIVTDDVVVGNIRPQIGETYQLRYSVNGEPVIYEVDEARYAPCGTGAAEQVAPPAASDLRGLRDDGATFDVLVVYTSAARLAAGGVAPMNALVDLAIAETNTAYANSQIAPRMRLAHKTEVAYTESGNPSTDLSRLSSLNDGQLDVVHGLRDDYGADLVSLLVSQMSGACGIGYLMTNLSTGFASSAFSVTQIGCATGNYTFGHELGHNMGCAHDRDNAGSGLFAYSFGYRTPDSVYRTVMAYAPGQRLQYFSNPNVSFAGRVLGIAAGSPGAAHNALSINNAAFTVANFRAGRDCNHNGTDDRCEVDCAALPTCPGPPACGGAEDCDGNEIPDECELDENDCNNNAIHDACDVLIGIGCNGSGIPDECELVGHDCNANLIPDACDRSVLAAQIAGPQPATSCLGGAVTFVVSTPIGSIHQWRRNGQVLQNQSGISGATSNSLTVAGIGPAAAGTYTCDVAVGCISVTTPPASLQIIPATLDIAQQPVEEVTICASGAQSAAFVCHASSELNTEYAWFRDGAQIFNDGRIAGATSAQLLISQATAADTATYTCRATNACGGWAESDPTRGRLVVVGASFEGQPQPTCTTAGGVARFQSRVDASASTQYFWYRNGTPLSNGIDAGGMVVSGAATPTLNLSNVPATYNGQSIQLVTFVSSPTCIGQSDLATLTVGATCGPCRFAGDLDGDLDADLKDMAIFTNCMGSPATPGTPCECANAAIESSLIELADWEAIEIHMNGPR